MKSTIDINLYLERKNNPVKKNSAANAEYIDFFHISKVYKRGHISLEFLGYIV